MARDEEREARIVNEIIVVPVVLRDRPWGGGAPARPVSRPVYCHAHDLTTQRG